MTKSYQINYLDKSITMLTIGKNFELVCYHFWCSGSLLFFHQAPQVEKETELKEWKRLEIRKNHLG